MSDRIQIVIIDRVQQYRFPRSKKRRIRKKWRKREENFRPMMVPVGMTLILGAEAGDGPGGMVPNYYEMSTDLWCYVAGMHPEWAERCDLYEMGEVVRNGVPYQEPIPLAHS